MLFFILFCIYWSVYHQFAGKEDQCMDECETTITKPDLTPPAGDVDDLIFCNEPDWYVSTR